ncbi:MAG: hypothetical protein ACR2G2_19770 [Pseudonocardia sp.]
MTVYTSAITTATVRVAGQIPVDITINHLGAPEQEASMRLGELLVYVREPAIAAMVATLWRQSQPISAALPYVAGTSRLHLPARIGLVGVVARLGGWPPCAVSWVPGRPGVAQPPHVRVEVGPIRWEICDQAAWHTIGRAWSTLHRQLAAGEPD